MEKDNATIWYVQNPISLGGARFSVTVIGYDEKKGNAAPYTVPRGHLVKIADTAQHLIEKWTRNKCIVPYDKKRHPDAFFGNAPAVPEYVEPEPVEEPKAKHSQAKPIEDETDDLPKVDEPRAKKAHHQAKPVGGRKYT